MIYVLFFLLFIFIMNKAILNTHVNSQNENFKRKINRRILQNRKLDELYGRKPKSPKQEIEKAIFDLAKNKKNIN